MRNIPILLIMSLFILLATQGVMNVGVYYDEVLHAVAAQEIINPLYRSEVHHVMTMQLFGHTVPIMILYYVGPIKAYILSLLFLGIPSDLITLRLFTIACATVTIFLTYKITCTLFDKKTALITAILLAIDPSFILSARHDWGPVALQTIGKLILLLLFMHIKTTRHKKYIAACIGLTTGLLIWDKLNAVWFILPIYIVFLDELRQLKNKIAIGLGYISGLVIGLFPLVIFIVKRPFFYTVSQESFSAFEQYAKLYPSGSNVYTLLQNYSSHVLDKITTTLEVLNGTSIPNYILNKPLSAPHLITIILVSAYIMIFLKLYKNMQSRVPISQLFNTPINKIAIIATGIFIWILVTPHANGPHHIMSLFPFTHILIAWALAKIPQKAALFLLMTILIINIQTLITFNHNTQQNNMKIFWKRTTLSELINEIKKINRPVVALDWGITLPTGFSSNGKVPIRDLQAFYEPKCAELQNLMRNEDYIAVRFTPENKIFPTYYTSCPEILNNSKIRTIGEYELLFL